MAKQRRATDQLNVALAGLEAGVAVMESMDGKPVPKNLVDQMRHYAEEARQHLTTIQFGLNQL